MQQAGEYIGGRELLGRGHETNTLRIEIRTRNIERKKVNSVPFCVRTAPSGKFVISLIYT